MKITKRQLRRIIREQQATAMGMTGRSDKLFDARDNLRGMIETMNPDEAGFFIEDLIRELQMRQEQM